MPADTTETLLFETSPFGTIDAIVEHDGRVVYFYLNEHRDASGTAAGKFGMRACWVRNLQRGPLVLDKEQMAGGAPPLMPRNDCRDQEAQQVPQADSLEVVWFEEGNGAALLEVDAESRKQTIAVIPPWSGVDGFHGYSLNCAYETPLAWPLPINESLSRRIDRAADFWSSFTKESSPFPALQSQQMEIYESRFGDSASQQYYAIDGGRFPPRGLIRYETSTETCLLTVGMSLCPQPAIELALENPSAQRRIELGVRLPHGDSGLDEALIDAAMGSLSSWASYPWRNHSWLGADHTIDFAATNTKAKLFPDEHFKLSFRDDPVNLLWIRFA